MQILESVIIPSSISIILHIMRTSNSMMMLEIIASLWRENSSRDLKTELVVRTV